MCDERTKILQRIANLRARASDDASSEAEVIACMNKAEKLMNAYRVSEADLALAEAEGRVKIEIVHKSTDASNGRNRHKVQMCWTAITTLTNTKGIRYTHTNRIELTGDAPDVEYALYLFDLIRTGMDRAYDAYRRENGGRTGRNAKANFQAAFASSVNRRLHEMAKTNRKEREEAVKLADDREVPSSRALLIVDAFNAKQSATQTAYAERHPRVRKGSGWSMSGCYNGSAASAGRSAGNRLSLGRAVRNYA
jgi:predicted metal-dependent HD superfamily phosphohydrolase